MVAHWVVGGVAGWLSGLVAGVELYVVWWAEWSGVGGVGCGGMRCGAAGCGLNGGGCGVVWGRLAGGASIAMFYVYLLGFDLLNIIGHCNFEFFPVPPSPSPAFAHAAAGAASLCRPFSLSRALSPRSIPLCAA